LLRYWSERSRNSTFPIFRGKTPDLVAAALSHRFVADAVEHEIASTVNELPFDSGTMLPAGLQILYLAE